eukprot:4977504-Pleurochrysis_carterae.AAC.10
MEKFFKQEHVFHPAAGPGLGGRRTPFVVAWRMQPQRHMSHRALMRAKMRLHLARFANVACRQ